jgi:hypothetical protein
MGVREKMNRRKLNQSLGLVNLGGTYRATRFLSTGFCKADVLWQRV